MQLFLVLNSNIFFSPPPPPHLPTPTLLNKLNQRFWKRLIATILKWLCYGIYFTSCGKIIIGYDAILHQSRFLHLSDKLTTLMIITCKYIQTIFQPYRQFCNNKLQKTISLALNSYKFKLHNFFFYKRQQSIL